MDVECDLNSLPRNAQRSHRLIDDADRARGANANLNQAERSGEKLGADAQAQFQDAVCTLSSRV